MSTKNIVLIIVFIIFMVAIVGVGIYFMINFDFNSPKPVANQSENNLNSQNQTTRKVPTKEEIEAKNQINFPDTLIGTIQFLEKNKATLKTENVEYVFYPNQPAGIYKSFGIEDGDKVEVQAKILQDNKIKWITIKKVSE